MSKYEYLCTYEVPNKEIERFLNDKGKEGWRLVPGTAFMEREAFDIKLSGDRDYTTLSIYNLELAAYEHGLVVGSKHPEYAKNIDQEAARVKRKNTSEKLLEAVSE